MRDRSKVPARGFTLIELMVAVVVNAVVILGALALLQAQQRVFQTGNQDRLLQETARTALSELTANLRRAGYGMDPVFAFDFGPLNGVKVSDYEAPVSATSTYGCTSASCRDSTAGADQIVFYARDPYFSRTVSAVTNSSVTFDRPLDANSPLRQGQVLLVMCQSGLQKAYVTVGAKASGGAAGVTLAGGAGTTFPNQNGVLTGSSSCISRFAGGRGAATVFKINRYHYFVQRYAEGGASTRPWLMMDAGLTGDDGALMVEPVAPDVEDVQFAYVFFNSPPASQVVGATENQLVSAGPLGIDLSAAPPTYEDSVTPPGALRQNNSPANIQAVRISLVTRTAMPDAKLVPASSSTIPAAANRPAAAGDPQYLRFLIESTAAVRNMQSRGPVAGGINPGGG